MNFLETPRFPSCPAYGYTAEPMYSVTHIEHASGRERSNLNWSRVKHRFTFSVAQRSDYIAEVLEFWHAVAGTAGRFRFKDWADYKSCRVTDTITALDQPLIVDPDSTAGDYQLLKRYTAGALTRDREIVKPFQGTIRIADDGDELDEGSDWTLDYATGLVTFASPPDGPVTWGGEFDVPVRFASELPIQIVSNQVQDVQIVLLEVRLQ